MNKNFSFGQQILREEIVFAFTSMHPEPSKWGIKEIQFF